MAGEFEKETTIVILEACPVAEGGPPCCRGCGGGWPGTMSETKKLTEALHEKRLLPDRLGCGVLVERARIAQDKLNRN